MQELKRTAKTHVLRSCILTQFSEYGRKSVDYEFDAEDGSSVSFSSFLIFLLLLLLPTSVALAGIRESQELICGDSGAHAPLSDPRPPGLHSFPPECWALAPPPCVPFCLVDNQALLFCVSFRV